MAVNLTADESGPVVVQQLPIENGPVVVTVVVYPVTSPTSSKLTAFLLP